MKTITFANTKGGSGKTTSVAFVAHALAELGHRVAVIDADPQGSLARWAEEAAWNIPTIALARKTLHRELPGIVGERYDYVLIDTPGVVEAHGIVHSAVRAADLVVVPIAPSMMELERIPAMSRLIEGVAEERGRGIPARILLNRTVANASSTKVIRELLVAQGHVVLGQTIARLERIAQALGDPIVGNPQGHLAVARELEGALA